MRRLAIRSFAKVNLGLEVLGLRQDGYHELRTLFQSIDLHDDILLRHRPRGIAVHCDHPLVPGGEDNLAARAALALARYAQVRTGADIRITKRIPVAAGLGGGSSNAAAVLLALDRLWGLGLGADGLQRLARRLGADVPFFLVGGTALGLGRGDEVYPLRTQVRAHIVVAAPGLPASTAAVYRRLDESLTPRENSYTIFRFVSRDLEGKASFPALSNDLEETALVEVPGLRAAVGRIRAILLRERCLLASLSGSGSSFFGLYDDLRRARRAEAALAAEGFTAFRCRTIPLDEYRRLWSRALGSKARAGRTR